MKEKYEVLLKFEMEGYPKEELKQLIEKAIKSLPKEFNEVKITASINSADSVTVCFCGDEEHYENRQDAIKDYRRYLLSAGGGSPEQRRYEKILNDLLSGKTYCCDIDEDEE